MYLAKFNSGRKPALRMLNHAPQGCYAMIHFGLNTFTDQEWGYGNADPALFDPAEFDAELLVRQLRDSGLDGVILVCKHHDGFCLWPTATTDYNISRAPFRNGKGDLVREVADACRKYELKMGFYVSPWDRHDENYGTELYVKKFQQQLREIHSNYGPAFEAWFDGANGGDGYYGGACETRKIDHARYYRWQETFQIIRDLQPNAAIFSDAGPDLRWVGNEKGLADEESFATFTPAAVTAGREPAPGNVKYQESTSGHADGIFFMPPECDFPLRPGWFYHAGEDNAQKSTAQLIDIFMRSAGCGGYFNVGLAPDRTGRLHKNDVQSLLDFKAARDRLFAKPIAEAVLPVKNGSCHLPLNGKSFNLLEMAEKSDSSDWVNGYTVEVIYPDKSRQRVLQGCAIGCRRVKKVSTVSNGAELVISFTNSYVPGELQIKLYDAIFPAETAAGSVDTAIMPLDIPEEGAWIFDLAAPMDVEGFIFTPQENVPPGTPVTYSFYGSNDGQNWELLAQGEFGNIVNNPVSQRVEIACKILRFCKLTSSRMTGKSDSIQGKAFALLRK